MVEEYSGSVVIVGGFIEDPDSDDIWRLVHAQSEWQKLPQKLPFRTAFHVAFFVPDTYTKCAPSSK